jgi:hypothetical protein
MNTFVYTHTCRPILVFSTSDFQRHAVNISTDHYQAVRLGVLLARSGLSLSKYCDMRADGRKSEAKRKGRS